MSTPNPDARFRASQVWALLERSASAAERAAGDVASVRSDLLRLIAARATRPWTPEEFEQFLVLSRAEAVAQRAYTTARRRFNHAAVCRERMVCNRDRTHRALMPHTSSPVA